MHKRERSNCSKAKIKQRPMFSISLTSNRLALYVYEYLLHVGAQKAAQTFLSEIRWEKNITLGEPPGFLHSWWCVFWDLYCAAPERRDTCEHSSEAKAFHDYGFVSSGYGVNGIAHVNPLQISMEQLFNDLLLFRILAQHRVHWVNYQLTKVYQEVQWLQDSFRYISRTFLWFTVN